MITQRPLALLHLPAMLIEICMLLTTMLVIDTGGTSDPEKKERGRQNRAHATELRLAREADKKNEDAARERLKRRVPQTPAPSPWFGKSQKRGEYEGPAREQEAPGHPSQSSAPSAPAPPAMTPPSSPPPEASRDTGPEATAPTLNTIFGQLQAVQHGMCVLSQQLAHLTSVVRTLGQHDGASMQMLMEQQRHFWQTTAENEGRALAVQPLSMVPGGGLENPIGATWSNIPGLAPSTMEAARATSGSAARQIPRPPASQ